MGGTSATHALLFAPIAVNDDKDNAVYYVYVGK
jgi:hypothetical protein